MSCVNGLLLVENFSAHASNMDWGNEHLWLEIAVAVGSILFVIIVNAANIALVKS